MSASGICVIIVNFNGRDRTRRCVESVLSEHREGLKCLVVDNGSQDGSPGFLRERFGTETRFRLIELDRNMGPAFARNRGIEAADAAYIAFLDNDTVVMSGWLDEPIRCMDQDPAIGACQCKLVLLDDPGRIDYVGDFLGPMGFLVQRAASGSRDEGQWEQEVEIFSAKSAGMVARRKAVLEAGLFDEDYFIYVEETDLDWRIWLAGYRIVYCPTSVVRHEYSTSRAVLGAAAHTRLVKFHGCKNYIATLVKNMGGWRLVCALPGHVGAWFGLACFELVRGRFRSGGWILQGIGWTISHAGRLLRKRRAVQRVRKVSDSDLWPRIYRRTPFSYYWRKLVTVPGTGHSKGF